MNASLQATLLRARLALLDAQTNLALVRKCNTIPAGMFRAAHQRAEQRFTDALDRVWDTQCMANGVFS